MLVGPPTRRLRRRVFSWNRRIESRQWIVQTRRKVFGSRSVAEGAAHSTSAHPVGVSAGQEGACGQAELVVLLEVRRLPSSSSEVEGERRHLEVRRMVELERRGLLGFW